MADETEKIDATTQKIAEMVKKVNDAMSDSADLASKMVDIFKKLNVEADKNQNALKLSNSFNKQILSDTKVRAMIERQMLSDIEDFQKKLIEVKREALNIEMNNGNAKDSIENAKKELKARQDLLKNIRSQAGYMANLEDANYAALGPLGGMVSKTKQFSENIKVIPLRFMLFNTLIKAGIDRFVELDAAAEKFRRDTGFSNTQMVELRKNAESINVEFRDMGVGINEVYAAAKALTDVFGRTSLISREAMQNVSLLAANLNVAVEDSANVLSTFQGLGGASQEAAMNVLKVGAGFSEKTGVPFSLVMKDIANAAGDTLSLIGANPTALMKSAIAARALGSDLNKLVSSQRKLLDFTTSMNDELTLSALIGKNISFQEARRLSLVGKTEDAARATLDIVKAAGDFESMNFIQREQLAKAAGMELKDLTKMLAVDKQRTEIENGSDMAARKRLREQTATLKLLAEQNDLTKQGLLDSNENAIRQQKMQGIMNKLKNTMESIVVSIADILEPVITPLATTIVPIFKFLAGILKVTVIPSFKLLVFPIQKIGELLGWISEKTEAWANSINPITDIVKSISKALDTPIGQVGKFLVGGGLLYALFAGKLGFGAVKKGILSTFFMFKNGLAKIPGIGGLGGGASAVEKVGDIAKSAKSSNFGEGIGKSIASFMKYIAKGIGYFGTPEVFKGALGIALVGFSIMPFAAAMKMFSGIDWKSVGIGSLALIGFTAAAFGLGTLLSTGVGAAIFGAGVIGIAALGASLIPFAAAALLAGAGIKMLGEGIASSVDPILRLSEIDLTKTALGIGAVGIALAAFGAGSAAAGLGSFVGGLLAGDPIKKMERLAAVGEKLKITAESISAISNVMSTFTVVDAFAKSVDTLADSLSNLNDQVEKISVLKLAAITAIGAAGVAATTSTSTNTTINTSGVEDKLDKLTSLLVGGAVRVYLDGKLVNSAMTISAG